MKTCNIHKDKKHYARGMCRFCYKQEYQRFHRTNIKLYAKRYWIQNKPFRVEFPAEMRAEVNRRGIKPIFVKREKNILEKLLYWIGGAFINASIRKRVANPLVKAV